MNLKKRDELLSRHPEFGYGMLNLEEEDEFDLMQQLDAFRASVAICCMLSRTYNFTTTTDFAKNFFAHKEVPFDDFFEMIHPDDVEHYNQVRNAASAHVINRSLDEIENKAIIFECRLRDLKGSYHRFAIKFQLIVSFKLNSIPLVVMLLYYLEPSTTNRKSLGYTIMDMNRRCYIDTYIHQPISKLEITVKRMVNTGMNNKEIAEKLGVTKSWVMSVRNSVQKKIFSSTQRIALEWLRIIGLL